jgi:hypothetical protein
VIKAHYGALFTNIGFLMLICQTTFTIDVALCFVLLIRKLAFLYETKLKLLKSNQASVLKGDVISVNKEFKERALNVFQDLFICKRLSCS